RGLDGRGKEVRPLVARDEDAERDHGRPPGSTRSVRGQSFAVQTLRLAVPALPATARDVGGGAREPAAPSGERHRERWRIGASPHAAPHARKEVMANVPPETLHGLPLAVLEQAAQEEAHRADAVAAELARERRPVAPMSV